MFLRVSEHLFRGPQPDQGDLEQLRDQGLRAVFNLREEWLASQGLARALDLNYQHIRVRDWHVPTQEQVADFLERLELPGWTPALVHCWGGVGRTGIFVSCYRIHHGMECELALRESDRETPHLGMSDLQRDWVRAWAADLRRD